MFSEMGEGVQVPGSFFPTSTFTFILIQDFLQEASHVSPCLYSWPCLPLIILAIRMALQKHQPVTSLTPAVNGFPSYLRTIFKPLKALTPLALATFLSSPPSTMGSLASTPPPLLLLPGGGEHTPSSGPSHELFPPLDTLTSRYQQGSLPHWVPLSPYWRRRDLPYTLRKTPSAIPHSHSSEVSLHLPILHGISP